MMMNCPAGLSQSSWMLDDGVTWEARFLTWQARQECERSRRLIVKTKIELDVLTLISTATFERIAKSEITLCQISGDARELLSRGAK